MTTIKYYCDWCRKEMSKPYYFTGSHIVVFGYYNYDERAVTGNEETVCEECYDDFKKLRRSKKEVDK